MNSFDCVAARDHRGGGPQGMQQSDDGWQSVGAKPQRAAIDPSKMKISQVRQSSQQNRASCKLCSILYFMFK